MNAIKNRKITQINNYNVNYANGMREEKIVNFIKYITNSDCKVKVKKNKFLWKFHLIKKKIRNTISHIFSGNFRKCFRFLKKCKKEFILIIILGVLISLLSLIEPAISGFIVSNLMNNKYSTIFVMVLLLFLFRLIILVLQFFLSKLYLIIKKVMTNNIRRDLLEYMLNFNVNNFKDNNSGVFIEKLNNDPNEIVKSFNSIKDTIINGFSNFGLIVYIFILDYRIGIILFGFSVFIFLIIIKGIMKIKKYKIEYYKNREKYIAVLGEMINGVSDIKSLDLKENYTKKTISSFELVSENEFQYSYYQKTYGKIVDFLQLTAILVVLFVGVLLVKNGSLDASSLIVIFMYNSTVFGFINRIGFLMGLISNLNISCDRVFSVLDSNKYSNEKYGDIYKKKCFGKIEFIDTNFKYNDKSVNVLNGCSFKIGSNECVSLVGKSGEGKTTILNLMSRLYSVSGGVIKIDGVDIKEYDEKFIRDNISVISQNPYLFDMSIKENLRLVRDDITDEEIIKVCKMVCLDEFIESLPHKYDTVIGEGGIKLSGGQKQRLGIARALIKNTKIILLDEVTSALDNETGTVIKKIINNIKKTHTVIVVTHELSMIKDSDRILILDKGKIVGDGSHNELIKNNSIYKKLYKIK